jgi:predicted transcriptional regulator
MGRLPREDALEVWRARRDAAVRQAFDALTPTERRRILAARRAAAKRRAQTRAQKRQHAVERRRMAAKLIFAGATREELAVALEVSPDAVRMYLSRQGLPHNVKPGFRRRWLWVRAEDDRQLAAVADDIGCSLHEALKRLVAACLEDGGHVARRQLGVRRRGAG